MSSFDLLLMTPREPPRAPAWQPHAHVGLVILLAVVEGVLGGWIRGGVPGVLVGGLIGVLVGPLLAWWLWLIHRSRRRLAHTISLGLVVQAAATILMAAAVQWLAGVRMLEVVVALTALLLGSVAVPLLMFLTITRERTWAVRGGIAGFVSGFLIVLAVFVLDFRAGDLLIALAMAALVAFPLIFVGAFAAAAVRRTIRLLRRLLIHIRCRRWPDSGLTASHTLDVADVPSILAAEPIYSQTALLLLSALRDGVETLYFETLGDVCRISCGGPDGARRLLAVPLSAERLAALLGVTAAWDRTSVNGEWSGRLPLRLGEQILELPLELCILEQQVHGRLLLPRDEVVLDQARRLWRDYAECRGDTWGCRCVRVTLQRQGGERRIRNDEVGAMLRLSYPGDGPSTMLFFQVRIEFDGRLLGTIRNFAEAFDHRITVAPGPHLLQLVPTTTLAAWRTRTFLLDVVEPGSYNVGLNWDKIWGGFKNSLQVRDGTPAARSPAEKRA